MPNAPTKLLRLSIKKHLMNVVKLLFDGKYPPAVGYQTDGLDNQVRNKGQALRLGWKDPGRWQLRPMAH